jgi:hypothetical protein
VSRVERWLGAVPGIPLRPFILGMLWLLIGCLIAAGVLWALDVYFVYPLLALIFAAVFAFVLPITALVTRRFVRDMDRLLAGAYLARWPIDDAVWERHASQEWRRARDFARRGPLYTLALALGIGGAAGVLYALSAGGARDALLTALGVGGVIVVVGLLVSGGTYLAGRWRYARRERLRGDVLIGMSGVYQHGVYTPFEGFNLRLARAELEPGDPTTLHFVTQTMTQYGTRQAAEAHVPVPPGNEAEAADLAAMFQREVIRR